jgi:hypothetical protein
MTKLAIIPCTVILETLFFRKKFRFVCNMSCALCSLKVYILIFYWLYSAVGISSSPLACSLLVLVLQQ